MQNGAEVESASRTGKGGRPRKSYDYLIGTVHHFLVIDRILPSCPERALCGYDMHPVRRPHRMPFARHPEWPHEELQVLAAGAVPHQRRGLRPTGSLSRKWPRSGQCTSVAPAGGPSP